MAEVGVVNHPVIVGESEIASTLGNAAARTREFQLEGRNETKLEQVRQQNGDELAKNLFGPTAEAQRGVLPVIDQSNSTKTFQKARESLETRQQVEGSLGGLRETAAKLQGDELELLRLIPDSVTFPIDNTERQHLQSRLDEMVPQDPNNPLSQQEYLQKQQEFLLEVRDARKAIRDYEGSAENAAALERVVIVLKEITQSEIVQRENLAVRILQVESDLLASNDGSNTVLVKKANVLLNQLQPGLDMVGTLDEQRTRLNTQAARQLGLLEGDENKYIEQAEKDALEEAKAQTEYPIKTDNLDVIRTSTEGLPSDDVLVQEQSRIIQEAQNEFFDQINSVRRGKTPPEADLTVIEKNQLARQWGITKEGGTGGTPEVYKIEAGSSMESLLIARALQKDGEAALRLNIDALKKGDVQKVEVAVGAAHMMVQGEVLEQMATAVLVGDMNTVEAQKAIKAAQALGMVEETSRLQELGWAAQDKIKDLTNKLARKTADRWHTIADWMKEPENWKKFGKKALMGLGIGVLVAIIVAIMAVSMTVNAIGGGMGGGRH